MMVKGEALSFSKRKPLGKEKSGNNIFNKGNEGTGRETERRKLPKVAYWEGFYSRKGQWFLVSAVIASGTFLAISILFSDYFTADTSKPALIDEDYHFSNVKSGMNRIVQLSDRTAVGGLTNMDRNLRAFIQFSKQELAEIGYFLHVEYTINDCNAKKVDFGILLASDRYVRCDNVKNPQAVLPGVKC